MADTAIEWTRGDDGSAGSVWNPTTGCDKVSPGCDNCYALTMAKRLKGMGQVKYQTDGDPRTSGPGFGLAMHEDALTIPLRWHKPRRIFTNSMSDLFHPKVTDDFLAHVFAVMIATPHHTYQVLTKRAPRMASVTNSEAFWTLVSGHLARLWGATHVAPLKAVPEWIWLGVSVEDQERADARLPRLRQVPALGPRWVSAEPLLGPVDLGPYLPDLGWVVVGGESGPGARPMHPAWPRTLRDQCAAAGVPFFFKQHGAWTVVDDAGPAGWKARRETDHDVRRDGYHWPISQPHGAEDGTEVLMRRVGKKAAGRELDGRDWNEMPANAG